MRAKKSLGQHFLRCRWVVSTLIRSAELTQKDTILEIGPGTGVLTFALAQAAGHVVAVEKDERLAGALMARLKEDGITNVEILTGDILRLLPILPQVIQAKLGSKNRYKVVANIPYYLTARLLRLLLEQQPQPAEGEARPDGRPELIVLTIQKEVAQRIVAQPPRMNLLALSVQAFGKPEIIKTVPASCFSPMPKVDSAIIKIADISDRFFRENRLDQKQFFAPIRRAFSQKRKLLLNTLGMRHSVLHKEQIAAVLTTLNLSKNARPQELSLQNWANLAKSL